MQSSTISDPHLLVINTCTGKVMSTMRRFRASPALKIASRLLVIALILLYINWGSLSRKPDDRINFKIINIDGSLQVFASSYNITQERIKNREKLPEQFDLRILVIVYNRATSLVRLLHSLNDAIYDNDRIKLEVWIDRSKNGSVDRNTLKVAKTYTFKHGRYSVHPRPEHIGIYGQWLATWTPVRNSSEIAVILEDDLTVSPYFYKYLKVVHKKYDSYPQVNGFAMQGISIKHSGSGFLQGPKEDPVFLYPVVGTWGYSPSTKNWIKFLEWFSVAYKDKNFQPLVSGNVASSWYRTFIQNGRADSMWEMWYIYYAWKNLENTLYPNFINHQGLTAHWHEKGLHYDGSNVSPSNPLLVDWTIKYQTMPDELVMLDIQGNKVKKH